MNSHRVPEDKIKIMIDNYEPFLGNLDEIKSAKDNRRRNGNKRWYDDKNQQMILDWFFFWYCLNFCLFFDFLIKKQKFSFFDSQ